MANPIDFSRPIRLVFKPDTEAERTVVEFRNGLSHEPSFGREDYYLEQAMKVNGIPIPQQIRDEFPEFRNQEIRRNIFLGDASFGKAFYEVYFLQNMNPDLFKWKN